MSFDEQPDPLSDAMIAWKKEKSRADKLAEELREVRKQGVLRESDFWSEAERANKLEAENKRLEGELAAEKMKREDCPCSGGKHHLEKCPYFRAEQAESEAKSLRERLKESEAREAALKEQIRVAELVREEQVYEAVAFVADEYSERWAQAWGRNVLSQLAQMFRGEVPFHD